MEQLRGNLASGDLGQGFKVPPLEPLKLTGLRFYRGPDVNCVFDDISVRGASTFVVEKLKYVANALFVSSLFFFSLLVTYYIFIFLFIEELTSMTLPLISSRTCPN